MSYTSRETSPDPLAGPSSPMGSRFIQDDTTERSEKAISRPQRRTSKPLAQRSHNIASPSKSFVMDTGAAGDASPWRIKVTVEAEPQNSPSPSKRVTRTTKVPLKGSSSSPTKKSPAKKKTLLPDESESEIKRPQRKRKGTPIRRNVKRASPEQREFDEEDGGRTGGIEMSAKLQEELSSPTKAPITRSKKKGTPQPSPAERARRLAKAQAELRSPADSDAPEDDAEVLQSESMAGDMTVANEDFTMISVATLESMKQGNSSLLLDQSGIGDRSAQSVSYLPSSPPQPLQAEDGAFESRQGETKPSGDAPRANDAAGVYDDMSWKPTGPLKNSSMLARLSKMQKSQQTYSDPAEYQLEREAVLRQAENASADQVVVIDSSDSSISGSKSVGVDEEEAILGAQQQDSEDDDDAGGGDDDIWAEEASRSLEEEEQIAPPQQSNTAAALNDLFSDQASKPPRGKIPRTWRRTSGMDFSYVDSPAHELAQRPTAETRKVSATSTASSKEGDGVLTPPDSSFEEEESKEPSGVVEEEADVDLTHPDAAATQLQVEERQTIERRRIVPARRTRDAIQSSLKASTSSNSLSSNDSAGPNDANEEEDTGTFWQTNLPSVFQQNRQRKWGSKLLEERRNRKKTADLSEILKSSSDVSIDPKVARQEITVARSMVAIEEEVASSQLRTEQKQRAKVVDSPLRKSLLKSSKIGDKTLPSVAGAEASGTGLTSKLRHMQMTASSSSSGSATPSTVESSFGESFGSKDSDQRQLLTEMNTPAPKSRTHPEPAHEDETDLWGAVPEEQDEQHPMSDASYARSSPGSHLQALTETEDDQYDEPDEETQDEGAHSSRMMSYEEHLNLDSPLKIKVKFNDSEGNSSMLAPKKAYPPLFSNQDNSSERIAVAKQPPRMASSQESGMLSRLTTTIWSALVRPSGPTKIDPTPEPTFSPSLSSQIRARYGVVSDQHPWTMVHMRTLHRLLNSSIANKDDNLIPRSGPLPAPLKALVGKKIQCLTDFHWTFTTQHAYIVDAFMQTLAPTHIVDAMTRGEVEMLGDDFAQQYRGFWGGRHGEDAVWNDETIACTPALRDAKGQIERAFVVRALGNAVWANVQIEEKEAREREVQRKRREWERRNGVMDDEESTDISTQDLSNASVERGRRRGR